MRTHTGEKPYRCPAPGCGKGFTCSKQLKVHSRTHTGERPYTCDICLRDFGYNHVLKLHRFQHYGERCYRCTVCDGTFNTKKQMEAHIYKEHGAETPRAAAALSTVPVASNGNPMCDLVKVALQQMPPTPPSSPPSPPCTITAVPAAASPALIPAADPAPAPLITPIPASTPSPSPSPPTTNLQFTLAPSSLPPRKRKLIPYHDSLSASATVSVPAVRHTSVIQFAPPAAAGLS
ncbi:Krueppel-likeous protein 1 [Papilio xuthus]|nr:Krueppel-likeous protein 1 [Papilio xuthus]